MNKNVIISVKGTRTTSEKDSNVLELVTEGTYHKKGHSYYITYKESQVTGMEGTTTTLKVKNGVVTLIRFGKVNSHFVFEQGQKHLSHYDTSNGTFTVGVFANAVNVNVDEKGGEIWVDYSLEIDNSKSGANDFYMNIREIGEATVEAKEEFDN
ncbi:MAG: DUF1934 domain-containing protein [Clostridiales bacterium]